MSRRSQLDARLPAGVSGVEVRADLTGELDPERLRRQGRRPLTYALRSVRHGGGCADRAGTRHARLRAAAARGYDLVDLEADHDLVPELLAAIPAHRRRISWSGGETGVAGLRQRFDRMARVPAALYLLAPAAGSFAAALAPLRLLRLLGRTDVTAFGTGPAGTWSRILAPWLGAPVVYSGGTEPPTVDQLVTDYPFPALPPLRELYGIVGRSFQTSLFPRLLNEAFRELSVPGLFLPFAVPDLVSLRTGFWPALTAGGLEAIGLPVRAVTVAAPYKQTALTEAEEVDRPAAAAQAANLLLRVDDRWRATTTDGSAVLAALLDAVPVEGRRAAVVGCGGAGRAAAVALAAAGARVTLVNRGESRGRFAADLLGLPFVPLAAFDPGRYPIVVHATPVNDALPFDAGALAEGSAVADFVCAAGPTALVAAARRRGLTTIDGRQVLEREVRQQLRLMTGRSRPATPAVASPV